MASTASDQPESQKGVPQAVIAQAAAAAAASSEDEPQSNPRQTPPPPPRSPNRPSSGQQHVYSSNDHTERPTGTRDGEGTPVHNNPRAGPNNNLQVPRAQETPIERAPPPAYGDSYSQIDLSQNGFDTQASVANDGRVDININQKSRRLSNLLVPALRSQLNLQSEEPSNLPPPYIPPSLGGQPGQTPPPPLNVVVQVVGSRGDVQPFVALGQVLKKTYGHRVRLATHATFRDFVEENGLEFFSIGGDPSELMAFMVKNPGLMPGIEALKSGDVGQRRKGMYEIVKGCWRSCYEAGDGMGIVATDDHVHGRASFDSGISIGDDEKPFVADAIIANPPSFAHIHCAEKLGIPLHMMFTMPWSPTQAFPHPLANIQSTNADANMSNFVSYALVEMMTWQGLGDIMNRFREKTLGLEEPKDWGSHISISGFYFLSLASNYTPAPDLAEFLEAGEPPVYIGFGSIVVDDPNGMTKLIFDAVKKAGVRALVSKGWGGFGAEELGIPEGVFMLGNVPHDWLFKHVSCVVHHGGAGTTAAGIALGRPTVVVPFFGDQPFWGAMVAKAGAGPLPIPYKHLTADSLAASITEALKPQASEKAGDLGARIAEEKGADVGAQSFHTRLDVDSLRCSLAPSRVAVWRVRRTPIRLSALAATVLGNEGLIEFSDLKLYRPREYDSEDGPWDPITGGASALMGTIGSLMMGVADMPVDVIKALKSKASEHSEHAASTASRSSTLNDRSDSVASAPIASTEDLQPPDRVYSPDSTEPGSPLTSRPSRDSHKSSMAQAMSGALSRSSSGRRGSRANSRKSSPSGHRRSSSDTGKITLDGALDAGKGASRIVGAGFKSPMDFTLSVARGFHNAPKLYGDDTVRQTDKITGFQSGLKAAGKEFGFGLYDGISGMVTQPVDGAKKEGFLGFLKGVGKGIGGVVIKPAGAFWALPGYTFKGIYRELQKHVGSSVQNYIIAARTAQGYEDLKVSTHQEQSDIISRWDNTITEFKTKPKSFSEEVHQNVQQYFKSKCDARKKHLAEKRVKKDKTDPSKNLKHSKHRQSDHSPALNHASTFPEVGTRATHSDEFEEAIQRSVTQTSRGDPEEDALIERAIRASVAELHAAHEQNDSEAVERAIHASMTGNGLDNPGKPNHGVEGRPDSSSGMERARALPHEKTRRDANEPFEDSAIDTDDDEDVRRAIDESKKHAHNSNVVEDDEELLKAISESKKSEQEEVRAKTEEEIVLEYIKKQSLAEEEHRKAHAAKGKSKDVEDDGEIKRAIAESLKSEGKAGESKGAASPR
ncbi:MAG: hypothetical protein M1835_007759 [Candelina submexicana]|nr:MAG: hypothetical protein M1835_007759 [Candelina submexicana]